MTYAEVSMAHAALVTLGPRRRGPGPAGLRDGHRHFPEGRAAGHRADAAAGDGAERGGPKARRGGVHDAHRCVRDGGGPPLSC